MPFNNGTFIKIPVNKDTVITADNLNTITEDIATGLNQTFLRDGSVALTGNLKAGNHKLTGLKKGTVDTDAATIGQLNTVQENAVLLTGDQIIAGIKTFNSSPIIPTPSANDSSTKAATTKWVNTIGNNVVHRTGTETIAGAKTFIDNPYINNSVPRLRLLNTNITKGTAPSADQGIAINFQDKDGNALGGVQTTYYTNKNVYTYLRSIKADTNTDTAGSTLGVMYPATGDPYATAPTTTATTSTTSTQIATAGWVNSTGNNLVHLTSTETITGTKTFTSNIKIENTMPVFITKISNLTKGATPLNTVISEISFNDRDGTNNVNHLGLFGTLVGITGNVKSYIRAYKNATSSTDFEEISITYPTSSNPYTYAPTPMDTTSVSSKQIATVGWVNSTGNNIVHLTDAETITGIKTFTGNLTKQIAKEGINSIFLKNTAVTRGIAPTTSNCDADILSRDSQDNNLGGMIISYDRTYKYIRSLLRVYKPDNSGIYNDLQIIYPEDGEPYAMCPPPTVTADSTTSNQIATVSWVNKTGNNVVHLTGNEIITGKKTFTYDIYMESVSPNIINRNTSIKKGTNPTEELICGGIYNFESSGNNQSNQLSAWTSHLRTDGTTFVSMGVYKNQANSIDNATIRIYYPKTSDPYTEAPIPTTTTSTSSTQIATTGWVNSTGNNIVHLTGTETIIGKKTFTSDPKISNDRPSLGLLESSVTKGTNPDTEQIWAIDCYDGSDNSGDIYRLGLFTTHLQSSGLVYTDMRAYKNIAGNSDNAAIRVLYPASGDPYTYAPASDVNNSIVTTINKSKSQNGYFKLGNGLIIQWGRAYIHIYNKERHTITLPTSFTTTNYSFTGTFEQYSSEQPYYTDDVTFCITDIKTTSVEGFGFDAGNNSYHTYFHWIAMGY